MVARAANRLLATTTFFLFSLLFTGKKQVLQEPSPSLAHFIK